MNQLMRISVFLTILSLAPTNARADKGTKLDPQLAKPGEVFIDDFESAELGKKWSVNKGSWTIQDGAVVGQEKKEDQHAAVLTLNLPHRDSMLQFSFKLDGAQSFNLSFNHLKGHLFRVAVAKGGLSVTKDKDAKDPNSKAVLLGKANAEFAPGTWHTMLIELVGDKVSVRTDSQVKLSVQEPSLNVDKTGYRFVTRGASSLRLDDVKAWEVQR